MKSVAQLASHWNLPVIGWLSSATELSNKRYYTTLIRSFGPLDTLGKHISTTFESLATLYR